MRTARRWIARLMGMFRTRDRDRELADEMASHIELHVAEEMRRGADPAEARRVALVAAGGIEAAKEAYRDQRGLPIIEQVIRDLSFSVRTLRRSPAFTVAALVSIGLGIGANTAVFSVVNGVILRPLPFTRPDQLVQVYATTTLDQRRDALTWSEIDEARRASRSFVAIAWYDVSARYLRDNAGVDRVMTVRASRGLFAMLGVSALIGRTFGSDDPSTVAVVAESFWRRRLGGDASVLGRVIELDGQPTKIVGVMPDAFQFPYGAAGGMHGVASEARTDLWWPADLPTRPGTRIRNITARLANDVSPEMAQRELEAIIARLPTLPGPGYEGRAVHVAPLDGVVVGDSVRRPLVVLFAAVAIVLALACTNVMNLSLVRMLLRRREVAVRAALGADRGRLARQFFIESVLLSLGGGAIGLVLAWWGTARLLPLVRAFLPRAHEVGFDGRVFLFLFGVCVVAAVAFGVSPALVGLRVAPQSVLQSGRATMDAGLQRFRDGLVVMEVALAFVLALAAAVLVRELVRLRTTNLGMDTRSAITFHVGHRMTPQTDVRKYYEIANRVSRLPNVEAAGFSQLLPLQNWGWSSNSSDFHRKDRTDSGQPVFPIELRYVTPGYFQALRIGVRGRSFEAGDDSSSPNVILINETLARRYFGNSDPVGLEMNRGRIVGVVSDVRQATLDGSALPEIYFPIAQNWSQVSELGLTLVVRARGNLETVINPIRAIVREVAPDHAIFNVRTMDDVISDSLSEFTLYLWLISALAALALVLAVAGTYGVISFVATSRSREFAIRAALGADGARVRRMMIMHGLRLAGIGLAGGLGLAIMATPLLHGVPMTVRAPSASTILPIALLVAMIALAASLGPAMRASNTDPMTLLREE